MTSPPSPIEPARVEVDLAAIRHNVTRLIEWVGADASAPEAPELMVVVKADAYGHGMIPVARAAREAGASWLGVATPGEALALRGSGDTGRLLCWLSVPGTDYTEVLRAGVDVTASSEEQLREIAGAAASLDPPAVRVHLKVDTGLSRNGAPREEWESLGRAAAALEAEGRVRVVGIWSHLACADSPAHPENDAQEAAFRDAIATMEAVGLRPETRHLANSAAAVLRPSARFDLVRIGIAAYGFSPAPEVVTGSDLGLIPAMTVRADVVRVKELAPGDGVSYGHAYTADRPMRVALVPLGYGDGVPRHASGTAEVLLDGTRAKVLGRICMDQFVVAGPSAAAGDEVVLFGPGTHGEPTATEWAEWCGTIDYEIVTRIGGRAPGRVRHTWVDAERAPEDDLGTCEEER